MNANIDIPIPAIELSPEQKYAFQKFKQGENLFVTGAGGTGKTKLIQYFVDYANLQKKTIQVCALTGCAAILLGCKAKTIHSWSGIKLARGESDKVIEMVLKSKYAVAAWKRTHILVIDEVSMMSKKIFDILDTIGRRVRKNNNRLFGGMQIVCTGDFYQLPPVGTLGEPETEMFCFESERWMETFPLENHIELKTMFRQKDPIYIDTLLKIRNGSIDETGIDILKKRVHAKYNEDEHNGCIPTKLYPTRNKVEYVNELMFDQLDEVEYHFSFTSRTNCAAWLDSMKVLSYDELLLCKKLDEKAKQDEINFLLRNTSCEPLLKLKKGSAVICTVNLNLDLNICNGSQGIITDIVDINGVYTPVVKFTNGCTHTFQPQHWQSEDYPSIAIFQYPLCLAWAMTIHKMQGATLDMAEMDIGNSIFEYGQTYVALSRIKSLNGLYLTAFNPDKIKTNPLVIDFYKNIPDIPTSTMNLIHPSIQIVDFTKYAMNEEDYVEAGYPHPSYTNMNTNVKKIVMTTYNNNDIGIDIVKKLDS